MTFAKLRIYKASIFLIISVLYPKGITGERNIYRRRADVEPELGAPQVKPKRLKLVVDVSGSMYR